MEQIVCEEQTKALGHILLYLNTHPDSSRTLAEQTAAVWKKLTEEGLESISSSSDCPPFMAMPRIQEIFACINRCRF